MLVSHVLMVVSTPPEIRTQPEAKVVKIPSTSGVPINGTIFGNGPNVVVLSNMDPNDLESWAPIVPELVSQKNAVLSYAYNRNGTERVKDLLEGTRFCSISRFLESSSYWCLPRRCDYHSSGRQQ